MLHRATPTPSSAKLGLANVHVPRKSVSQRDMEHAPGRFARLLHLLACLPDETKPRE